MNNPAYKCEREDYEIINGKVYMMSRPSINHAQIEGNINSIFKTYLKGKTCRPFNEVDVFFDDDNNFVPDVLILDYGALLKSTANFMDKRNAIESNFEEMRAIADDYNLALWSAAQGNRGALSKKVVSMGDLAECFAIANIADVMVCMCQTIQEKRKGDLRMFLPKIRDNADTMMLLGKIWYDIKRIEMTEIGSNEEEKEEKYEETEDWEK